MISCTDFIPAYSELFAYLESKGGKDEVRKYWEYISDNGLRKLAPLIREHGIRGCWMYWSETLNEEAADFTMTLDEEAGVFEINMHHCPSKGRLLELKHIEPYEDYCMHCDLLYRRVVEPLGYSYAFDYSETDRAKCGIKIIKQT